MRKTLPFLFQRFYKSFLLKGGIILFMTVLPGCLSDEGTVSPSNRSTSTANEVSLPNSSSSLKELISKQYPDIENPGTSDWQKVNLLRRWAYKNIVTSTRICLLENVLEPNFYKKTAPELYAAFKQDKGGVWCGGSSVFLEKLYHEYGFNAYTVNMGKSEYLTHVVNLVEIWDQGQKKLVIEDAYFNMTYTAQNGAPLDYFAFLKLLCQLKDKQIKVVKDDDGERSCLLCKDYLSDPVFMAFIKRNLSKCIQTSVDKTKCNCKVILDALINDHPSAPKTKQFLAKAGYKPNLIYLYLYPFSINSEKAGVRQDLLNRAQTVILFCQSHKRKPGISKPRCCN